MMLFKKDSHAEFIDVADLKVGHYIFIDLGWMGHPFALNSFRISSDDQIVTLRGLGLKRLRYSSAQSRVADAGVTSDDMPIASPVTLHVSVQSPVFETGEAAKALETQEKLHRHDTFAAQRASLQRCENQFNDAARSYRAIVDSVLSDPLESKRRCEEVVDRMIDHMGPADEETLVRLLSEKTGERTSLHSINVSIISLLLAKALSVSIELMREVGQGALLHDIGKMELPDRLCWSAGDLTDSELTLYRDHVGKGIQIGRKMRLSPGAQVIIGQHHEHANGSGYPQGLRGDQISLAARIVCLVNQYDNLCNPANPALAVTPHEALSLLYAQSKQNFDPKVLAVFIRLMGVYPPGSVIELSTGRHALVVSVNSTRPLRPNILVHDPAVAASEAIIVDLESCPDLGIRRSIKPVQLPKAAYDYLSPRKRLCYFFERAGEIRSTEIRNSH